MSTPPDKETSTPPVKIERTCYCCSKCGLIAGYEEQPCPLCRCREMLDASTQGVKELLSENATLRQIVGLQGHKETPTPRTDDSIRRKAALSYNDPDKTDTMLRQTICDAGDRIEELELALSASTQRVKELEAERDDLRAMLDQLETTALEHAFGAKFEADQLRAEAVSLRSSVAHLKTIVDGIAEMVRRDQSKESVPMAVQRVLAEVAALKADRDAATQLLHRFFHEGQSLGASHRHFAAYVAHPADLWDATKAFLAARSATPPSDCGHKSDPA